MAGHQLFAPSDDTRFLNPGDENRTTLYTYNPGYLDKSNPSEIKLVILSYAIETDDPIVAKKQNEIIHQGDENKLKSWFGEMRNDLRKDIDRFVY